MEKDYIMTTIHPFILKQIITVYKNGEKVDEKESSLDDLENNIRLLSREYNIANVGLAGDSHFTTKIKDNLSDLSKFNKFLNVTIF